MRKREDNNNRVLKSMKTHQYKVKIKKNIDAWLIIWSL